MYKMKENIIQTFSVVIYFARLETRYISLKICALFIVKKIIECCKHDSESKEFIELFCTNLKNLDI